MTKQLGERGDPAANDPVEARFQRFMGRLHGYRQARIHQRPTGWPIRRWLALAAVPLVALGFLFVEPHTAVIEADELVKQATTAEQARPAGTAQRVSIKLTPSTNFAMSGVGVPIYATERELTDGILAPVSLKSADQKAERIAHLLADHHFNWQQPLSMLDFNAWRNGLSHKHDEVISLRGSPHFRLRTTTDDDGDLHEVELTIERESYRVVRETFVFENDGTLDIEQRAQWVKQLVPTPALTAPAVAKAPVPTRPVRERTDALASAQAPPPDLSRWLDRRFGNSSARTAFMPDLRRLTGAVRQRLKSLSELADRYPGSEGPEASPSAQARMQRELDLEYQSLRGDLDALYPSLLTLTLPSEGVSRRPLTPAQREPHAPADWSRRIARARPQAATLDRLAGELRAYDDLPEPVQQRLADVFDALWSAIYAPES